MVDGEFTMSLPVSRKERRTTAAKLHVQGMKVQGAFAALSAPSPFGPLHQPDGSTGPVSRSLAARDSDVQGWIAVEGSPAPQKQARTAWGARGGGTDLARTTMAARATAAGSFTMPRWWLPS